jgi:hypothetical protein
MNESQNSRSQKLEVSLQRVQTDMQDLASRLLDVTVSIQRIEVKLDRIAESGISSKSQQWPQKYDKDFHADLQSGVTPSIGRVGSRTSESSNAGRESQIKLPPSGATYDDEIAETVDTQREAVVWKQYSHNTLAGHRLVKNSIKSGSDFEESLIPGDDLCEVDGMKRSSPPGTAKTLLELDTKFTIIDKKLERISASMKIKGEANDGDDEEDRRRLKEKLKVAIDLDRRSRVHTIVSRSEVWLEYIFGICSPDQRLGKRGSRWNIPPAKNEQI